MCGVWGVGLGVGCVGCGVGMWTANSVADLSSAVKLDLVNAAHSLRVPSLQRAQSIFVARASGLCVFLKAREVSC